ncbi:MAG: hypothetical protein GY830_08790 [Bacteroidetes bacterium]|nr:hypothetical protein [Bacteroidota bacterium]
MDIKLQFLLKFHEKKIIEDMYENGAIFMNTIDYFENTENKVKKDKNENITHLSQSNKMLKFNIAGKNMQLVKNTQVKIKCSNYMRNVYTHKFSFFGLYSDDKYEIGEKIFDKKMLEHGKYLLLILNPKEFFKRFLQVLKDEIIQYYCDRVQYINEKIYEGEMGPFKKFEKFAYEKEYRICINHSKVYDHSVTFKIGNLKDIAYIISSSDLKNKVEKTDKGYAYNFF